MQLLPNPHSKRSSVFRQVHYLAQLIFHFVVFLVIY